MTAVEQIRLVAEREFVEYARQRAFRSATLISVAVIALSIAAYSVLPALFGGPTELRVGALPDAAPVVESLALHLDPNVIELAVVDLDDRGVGEPLLRGEELDVVLLDGSSILILDEIDEGTVELLQEAMSIAAVAERLDTAPAEAASLLQVPLSVEELEPVDPAVGQRRVLTLIAVMMAMSQVMTGAFVISSGTVEEKSSRVIEVVVSKVHPRTLLTGKLVGLGLVLLVQLLLFVSVGLVGLALSPDLHIPTGLPALSGAVLLWYVVAFAIYGSLFSVAAALSSRQEDMAQKMAPMMYLMFAAFAAAVYAFGNPDTILTRIVSYVPFTAPAVLPARQAVGAIAGWEVALAVCVTLLGAVLAVRFAGRVYTAGALRTRGTSTVRKALQTSDTG